MTEDLKQSLRACGPEYEARRLELLRGRRFLIVMGSYQGKRHLYEHIRACGVSLVVMDGPGHWAKAAVQDGLFEQFIEVDLYPTDTLPDRALKAITAAGLHFDAIATFEDYAGPLTAILAKDLGLRGHPLPAILASRNKVVANQTLREAGIPTPRFFHVCSSEDLEPAAAHVGFPAVLKPIAGAAQIATYRVNTAHQLQMRYTQTMSEVARCLKTNGVHSVDDPETVWAYGLDMTLEEYLDGEEFDVDILLSEGDRVYVTVIRDLPNPYLKSGGTQMPPDFPADKQEEMAVFAELVLRVLGFTDGAFHVEVKYTSRGPRLIEVNARLGGGPIYEFHRRVWNVDLVEQYFMSCLGLPIRPQKAALPLTCMVTSDLICPQSGIITHPDFLLPIACLPQVVRCKTFVNSGQFVIGPDLGVPESLGEIMVFGATVEEASQTLEGLLRQVVFPIAISDRASQTIFQGALE